MTHDAEQHIHDSDPPPKVLRPCNRESIWANPCLDEELRALWKRWNSDAQIAASLNQKFNLTLTRNAVIGRRNRLGLKTIKLVAPDKLARAKIISAPRIKRERKTVIRIVASNGNSNSQRIFKSVTEGLQPLRCVEVVSLNISLLDLEPDHCRYPYGKGPFTFCGHPVFSRTYADGTGTIVTRKSSYCGPHTALTTELPRKQRVESAA